MLFNFLNVLILTLLCVHFFGSVKMVEFPPVWERAADLACHLYFYKLAWTKSRRANAQPPASMSALALVSASTFMLKFFKSLYMYFLNHFMDLFHIWHNDRYRSKVYISNILFWPIGHKGQTLGHKVKSSEGTV